jgi:hypothetical protein
MVLMRYVLLFVLLLGCGAARGAEDLQQPTVDFEATAVHEAGAFRESDTIHYTQGKLRVDPGDGFSSTILDLTTQTECLLMVNHTYLVLPMDDELYRRFIAHSPALRDWRNLGRARVEGLETTKYAFGDDGALKAAGFMWLTDSGIMVRREYDDGVFGKTVHHVEYLKDVVVKKQDAGLFAVPAGYAKAR